MIPRTYLVFWGFGRIVSVGRSAFYFSHFALTWQAQGCSSRIHIVAAWETVDFNARDDQCMVKTSITCRILQICVFRSRFVARCIHELLAIADIVISKFGTLELCWELWCYTLSSTSLFLQGLEGSLQQKHWPVVWWWTRCHVFSVLPMRFWRLEGCKVGRWTIAHLKRTGAKGYDVQRDRLEHLDSTNGPLTLALQWPRQCDKAGKPRRKVRLESEFQGSWSKYSHTNTVGINKEMTRCRIEKLS